jgi:hypothetical protein
MIDDDSLHPATVQMIKNIEPKVRDSLTPNQMSAIIEAAEASRKLGRHPVDLRGVIPLYFAKYYFVFLMGRDRRSTSRKQEKRRLEWTSLLAWSLFVTIVSLPFIVLLLGLLYLFKSSLGLDFIPDEHLSDLIDMQNN